MQQSHLNSQPSTAEVAWNVISFAGFWSLTKILDKLKTLYIVKASLFPSDLWSILALYFGFLSLSPLFPLLFIDTASNCFGAKAIVCYLSSTKWQTEKVTL